jgi:hypothetical protein
MAAVYFTPANVVLELEVFVSASGKLYIRRGTRTFWVVRVVGEDYSYITLDSSY